MKNFTLSLLFVLLTPCAALAQVSDTLFIEKTDGSMLIIPEIYIEGGAFSNTGFTYNLTGYNSVTFSNSEIKGTYHKYPKERPQFLSFKFNNKFNDQLFKDTTAVIDNDNGKVTAHVGCIGKRLTPSFKLPEGASAYVNGQQQTSKESRLRFDESVRYTVAYPNQQVYTVKSREAINSSYTNWITIPVSLTASMLSTNAPSNYGEDPANLIDGSTSTFFHSTWIDSNRPYTYPVLPSGYSYEDYPDYWPYLQINLTSPISDLSFSYTTRTDNAQRCPRAFILQASNDGYTWTDIRTFTVKDDGLPTNTAGATFTSPVISLGQSYSKLRLQLTAADYKNYLALSEFYLYQNTDPQTYNIGESTTSIPIVPVKSARKFFNNYPRLVMEMPYEVGTIKFEYTTRYLGDVDKNGSVNQNDVTALTNIMLGKRYGLDMSVDDINRDGNLSLADITALCNAVRNNTSTVCAPQRIEIWGSNNGSNWHRIQTISSDLPTTANTTYTSEEIAMGETYKYLSLRLSSASDYKGYFNMCDLKLYHIGVIQEGSFQPYGMDYDVEVDFLTDNPTTEYNVPRIDITFGDGQSWNSSMWIGRYGKEYYEDATISIDGAGVYPDMAETPMQIRGRGNTSWTSLYSSKNPYRIKFAEKQKPFGMTKGKSWVLLSNKQTGSMTTNAIAMKIADMVESKGCNHIVPCELYINGQYRGSYNFTENPGFSNNSIDLYDESNAALLELDSYYDETYRFRDAYYTLPVNIKEPDLDEQVNEIGWLTEEEAQEYAADIELAFNTFTYDTQNGGTSHLDVDAFVRAMLVNDLVRNEEYKHPKSWKLYNPDFSNPDSLWTFGPVWDFDWSFGYDGPSQYFVYSAETDLFSGTSGVGVSFFYDLLRGSETVKRAYYLLWKDFMESGKLDELIEYCDDYYNYVAPSFEHNYTKWSDGYNYDTHNSNAKSWLRKRANYIYNSLQRYE